jgi:hypothetical protein
MQPDQLWGVGFTREALVGCFGFDDVSAAGAHLGVHRLTATAPKMSEAVLRTWQVHGMSGGWPDRPRSLFCLRFSPVAAGAAPDSLTPCLDPLHPLGLLHAPPLWNLPKTEAREPRSTGFDYRDETGQLRRTLERLVAYWPRCDRVPWPPRFSLRTHVDAFQARLSHAAGSETGFSAVARALAYQREGRQESCRRASALVYILKLAAGLLAQLGAPAAGTEHVRQWSTTNQVRSQYRERNQNGRARLHSAAPATGRGGRGCGGSGWGNCCPASSEGAYANAGAPEPPGGFRGELRFAAGDAGTPRSAVGSRGERGACRCQFVLGESRRAAECGRL